MSPFAFLTREKPIPMKYMVPRGASGEVKITTPADPEKVRAYREEQALRKKGFTQRRFSNGR